MAELEQLAQLEQLLLGAAGFKSDHQAQAGRASRHSISTAGANGKLAATGFSPRHSPTAHHHRAAPTPRRPSRAQANRRAGRNGQCVTVAAAQRRRKMRHHLRIGIQGGKSRRILIASGADAPVVRSAVKLCACSISCRPFRPGGTLSVIGARDWICHACAWCFRSTYVEKTAGLDWCRQRTGRHPD